MICQSLKFQKALLLLRNSGSAVCHEPMIKRQGLAERKVGLFKMPQFQEDGELPSQRPPFPFLERSRGFIGTQEEEEQRKAGVSQATPLCWHPGKRLLGSSLFHDGYLKHGRRGDSYVI